MPYIPQRSDQNIIKKARAKLKQMTHRLPEKLPSFIEPFFSSSEVFLLGERHIKPYTYDKFIIGKSIAWHNKMELVDFDRHKGNFITNIALGRVSSIDPGYHRAKLSPAIAAESLVPAFMTYDPDEFHAVLSGFVSYSLVFIDPTYENFTLELLDILGGSIASMPEVRPKFLDLNCTQSDLKFSFKLNEREQVELDRLFTDSDLFNGWSKHPEELFLIASCFAFSGIDISGLLLKAEIAEKLPERQLKLHSFMYGFLTRSLTEEEEDNIPSDEYSVTITVLMLVLADLSNRWGYPDPDVDLKDYPIYPGMQPDHMARNVLIQTINQISPEASIEIINSLIDFDNYLANVLYAMKVDNDINLVRSKSSMFTRSAYILLQYGAYGSDWDDSQINRISRDRVDFEWENYMGDQSFNLVNIGILNSRGNAFSRLFSSSIELLQKYFMV